MLNCPSRSLLSSSHEFHHLTQASGVRAITGAVACGQWHLILPSLWGSSSNFVASEAESLPFPLGGLVSAQVNKLLSHDGLHEF